MVNLNFCQVCKDYNILNENKICESCEKERKSVSGFANYLYNRACFFRDQSNRFMLNLLKEEARKCKENGYITNYELLRIEKIFITLHPT